MSIIVECQCGKRFKTGAAHAGKATSCPNCGRSLTIPLLMKELKARRERKRPLLKPTRRPSRMPPAPPDPQVKQAGLQPTTEQGHRQPSPPPGDRRITSRTLCNVAALACIVGLGLWCMSRYKTDPDQQSPP
jgi:hypothetical protein